MTDAQLAARIAASSPRGRALLAADRIVGLVGGVIRRDPQLTGVVYVVETSQTVQVERKADEISAVGAEFQVEVSVEGYGRRVLVAAA